MEASPWAKQVAFVMSLIFKERLKAALEDRVFIIQIKQCTRRNSDYEYVLKIVRHLAWN